MEGYELEVLEGLSTPLRSLSFEFTVERLESRLDAVRHLDALGMRRFNFSSGESMRLSFGSWLTAEAMLAYLRGPSHTTQSFGDVYARA